MAKSRARFLAELLGTDGLVKKAKSALAGADEVIDLSALPSIPNSKLTNSSITINSSATSLGGSVTLTTANVAENTNLYYTDARADARIAAADTGDLSEGSNLYYTNARADARIAAADTGDLSEGSNLYYTDARADARVALVVDSAPSTLNTLNELAAALGDDANFSTTVTNSIAAKLPKAGGTMTGGLNMGSQNISAINNATAVSFLSTNGYWVGGTQRMNGSGNLVNIGTISSGAITTTNTGGLGIQTSGYSLLSAANNARAASGSLRLGNGVAGTGFVLDYTDQGQTVATIRNAYVASNTSELTIQSPFITFDTGTSYTEALKLDHNQNATFAGDIKIGADTVIDSSRNLTNIGTISSGAITSTGAVTGTYFSDGYVTWTAAQFNRSGASIEFQFTPTNANWKVKIGANGDNPTEFNAYTGDADFSGEVSTPSAKLKAIAESNTDSAVDVFVYDTRKDSDGGAWRKRTQNTSWYNETLNTSTRGARKEFPAVAVIVTEAAQVTIYDGDDPDMPMWMVFNGINGGSSYTWHGSGYSGENDTCASMKNGVLCIGVKGTVSSVSGLSTVSFIDEVFKKYGGAPGFIQRPVSLRNSAFSVTYISTGYDIAHKNVNDVAMTVLPNAPIDADTGLPVPTIAVATPGGVSVIKDDGYVVNVMTSNSYGVAFTKNHELIHTVNDASSTFTNHVREIPSANTNTTATRRYYRAGNSTGSTPSISGTSAEPTADILAALPNNTLAVATSGDTKALNILQEVPTAPATGMVAYIASDYNTGWMVGDIKLATLSDTDTTNAVSTELLGGIGNFTDANAWTVPSGWSLSSNVATGSGVTAYLLPASNGILTAGRKYAVTVTQSAYTSGTVYLYMGTGASSNGNHYVNLPSTGGTFTYILNAYNSNFGIYGANYTGVIDNVTISLAEQDRSVNNKGLQVFGTVTKTAVATGAELVVYSGFSSSNALQTPYSSSYAVGTEFSASMWLKGGADSQTPFAVESTNSADNDSTILVHTHTNGFYFYTRGANDASWGTTGAASIQSTNVGLSEWHMVTISQDAEGRKLYIDGKLNASDAVVKTIDGVEGTLVVNVGGRPPNFFQNYSGKISLVRFSGTPVTPEQAAKMYNDEKHLFQENAKATLYGSSNAVTALAYDDSTELLHVGTSAGRSVFQGLRRVDNTTDAVGAAISASNGFIVED